MKNLKLFCLIFLPFILSGCTLNYELNISSDMLIDENMEVIEKNSVLSSFNLNLEGYIDDSINTFSSDERYKYYSYDKDIGANYSRALANATYLDFEDFKKNDESLSYFFSNISITENKNIIELNFTANKANVLFDETVEESSILDNATISITLPFHVINNNADVVNLIGKTYSWNYSKEKSDNDIHLTFDTSKAASKVFSGTWYIVIAVFIVVVALFLYTYYKYKKNNEF